MSRNVTIHQMMTTMTALGSSTRSSHSRRQRSWHHQSVSFPLPFMVFHTSFRCSSTPPSKVSSIHLAAFCLVLRTPQRLWPPSTCLVSRPLVFSSIFHAQSLTCTSWCIQTIDAAHYVQLCPTLPSFADTEKTFEKGDVVWARQKNSRFWPCQIVEVDNKKKPVYKIKYLSWEQPT